MPLQRNEQALAGEWDHHRQPNRLRVARFISELTGVPSLYKRVGPHIEMLAGQPVEHLVPSLLTDSRDRGPPVCRPAVSAVFVRSWLSTHVHKLNLYVSHNVPASPSPYGTIRRYATIFP